MKTVNVSTENMLLLEKASEISGLSIDEIVDDCLSNRLRQHVTDGDMASLVSASSYDTLGEAIEATRRADNGDGSVNQWRFFRIEDGKFMPEAYSYFADEWAQKYEEIFLDREEAAQ